MKFLCDRCKTRYSIADERVRGKILKIRCKNCANVITVREGMPEPNPADLARRTRVTDSNGPASGPGHSTPSIQPAAQPAAPAGALGAAFASQMAKPPPALDEEWYVSIDGQQAGPFSLADAQRWVASKPYTAELHCWSEGFDDWLPVDKVSHFRGLRKPPQPKKPTIPPPIPAPAPKPLFAATMASIERAATSSERHTAPPVTARHASAPIPSVAGRVNGMPARVTPSPSHGFRRDDSTTDVDAPPIRSDDAMSGRGAAHAFVPRPPVVAPEAPIPPPLHSTVQVPLIDDDSLEIGEVSRVVKLADLQAMEARKEAPAAAPPQRSTGTFNVPSTRRSASMMTPNRGVRLSPTELGMKVDPTLAAYSGAGMPDDHVAKSFAKRHRRGMMVLIAASAAMVLGGIAIVAFIVMNKTSDDSGSLGAARVIDTTRPEDIVRQQAGLPPAPGSTATPLKPHTWRPTQHVQQPQLPAEEPGGPQRLDASDIEDMAQKQGEGTKRCYIRAQKGALGLEIAELKKIDVTLTVSKEGSVTDVQLSSHGGDTFGQCLVSRIKGWKFRESKGGTFRIALAFSSG